MAKQLCTMKRRRALEKGVEVWPRQSNYHWP